MKLAKLVVTDVVMNEATSEDDAFFVECWRKSILDEVIARINGYDDMVVACKNAMTTMQEITAHERKQGGAKYDYFDDEIAAWGTALNGSVE